MRLFILTLNKYLTDNRRHFLLCLAGLAALSIFMGLIYSINEVSRPQIVLIFTMFYLGIFACIRASLMFSSMKTPRGRISTLMSPSSSWNKFAARWVVNIPITLLVLCGAFWLTEDVRVLSWPMFHEGATTEWFSFSSFHFNNPESRENLWILWSFVTGFLALQAFFCFGAIAWPRMSALKSVLTLWIFTFLFGTVAVSVDHSFTANPVEVGTFIIHVTVFVNSIATLVLWGLTYMRFRESEVADRLF